MENVRFLLPYEDEILPASFGSSSHSVNYFMKLPKTGALQKTKNRTPVLVCRYLKLNTSNRSEVEGRDSFKIFHQNNIDLHQIVYVYSNYCNIHLHSNLIWMKIDEIIYFYLIWIILLIQVCLCRKSAKKTSWKNVNEKFWNEHRMKNFIFS